MSANEIAFTVYGVTLQAVLLAFFAARRWAPRGASWFGWTIYAFAGLGLPLGLWLLIDGESWPLVTGPLLAAAWAAFGAMVDVWRPRQWRRPPIAWRILLPYVVLYFFAQMFLWWPLWDLDRPAWIVFLVLFVPNTALNVSGHSGPSEGGS